jgi:ankyrin repeat protein
MKGRMIAPGMLLCVLFSTLSYPTSARPNDGSRIALISAVRIGDKARVESLLAEGADVDARDEQGYTALHYAVIRKDLEIVRVLLDHGADLFAQVVSGQYSIGDSAITLAALYGHSDIVSELLSRGASVDTRDRLGTTALMKATVIGNMETIRTLLENGSDVNARNNYGETALMFATNDSGVVKLLVKHGADVNAESLGGFTPLMYAAQHSFPEKAEALIAVGADVSARNVYGESALGMAQKWKQEATLASRGSNTAESIIRLLSKQAVDQ